jgi:ribonuclease P protein component
MSRKFVKKERLRKRAEFHKVFKSSRRVSCRGLKLLYRNNEFTWNRSAFICAKGQGNAVKRNREKRVAREIYRNIKENLKTGYDLIFVLYPEECSTVMRKQQFEYVIRKARLNLQK